MSNLGNYLHSSDLYADPSFSKGVARSVDMFSLLDNYNYKKTEKEADEVALRRDWYIIGRDIAGAIEQYECKETHKTSSKARK